MGTNSLVTVIGGIVQISHPNQFKEALSGDLVPRNSSGVAATIEGALGSDTYKWLKAFIASGYWDAGDIKAHHTYDGVLDVSHGWMKCDGRQITEAAYNTEHGSGTWDTYIGTSPLENLYLPDLTNTSFLAGANSTTDDGTVALPLISSNTRNLAHTHTVDAHNHKWYNFVAGAADQSFSSSGTAQTLPPNTAENSSHIRIATTAIAENSLDDSWTDNNSPGTDSMLSSSTSIIPSSLQVIYYMRII